MVNDMGFLSKLFGGRDDPELAPRVVDPLFTKSQDTLDRFGTDILSGNVPDYFASIGEKGSPEFEDVLQRALADVQRTTLEGAAKLGQRGGNVSATIARRSADVSSQLRFQDLLSSISGKRFLLSEGRGITEGVRGAAFQEQEAQNQRSLTEFNIEASQKAAEDQAFSDLISSIVGIGTDIFGLATIGVAPSSILKAGSKIGAGGSVGFLS